MGERNRNMVYEDSLSASAAFSGPFAPTTTTTTTTTATTRVEELARADFQLPISGLDKDSARPQDFVVDEDFLEIDWAHTSSNLS